MSLRPFPGYCLFFCEEKTTAFRISGGYGRRPSSSNHSNTLHMLSVTIPKWRKDAGGLSVSTVRPEPSIPSRQPSRTRSGCVFVASAKGGAVAVGVDVVILSDAKWVKWLNIKSIIETSRRESFSWRFHAVSTLSRMKTHRVSSMW